MNHIELTNPKSKGFPLRKAEPFIFWIMLLGGLIPLITHKYFVTLDGPSHLYNGYLVKYLLSGDYPAISQLFTMNPFPVPNWFSHFLFTTLGIVLPGLLAEKVVLFLYLFFTPLLFRKLILFIAPENRVFSWLMILFVHNQNFYFGFFNFSFGILFMFLTLHYYIRNQNKDTFRTQFLLCCLFLLLYFSHLMVFMVTFILLIILSAEDIVISNSGGGISVSGLKQAARRAFRVPVAALPAILLTLGYLFRTGIDYNPERLPFQKLVEWIADIRPLLAIRYGFPWKSYTYLLFIVLVIMILFQMTLFLRRNWKKKEILSNQPRSLTIGPAFVFLLFTLGFLIFLFIMPNFNLISERLIFFFFLFLITWLSILHFPRWVHYTMAIVVIVFHISFTRMYHHTIGGYSEKAMKLVEVTRDMQPGEVILPLNYNEKWNFMHISGYVGTDHPCAILDNYEAWLPWFPVQWNRDQYDIGNTEDTYIHTEAPDFFTLKPKRSIPEIIPNILLIYRTDSGVTDIPANISAILDKSYIKVSENDFCALFRIKNQ
jgi:hypothetical protein